jgi:hypothetical protein
MSNSHMQVISVVCCARVVISASGEGQVARARMKYPLPHCGRALSSCYVHVGAGTEVHSCLTHMQIMSCGGQRSLCGGLSSSGPAVAGKQLNLMASASGLLQLNGFATFSRIMQACHKGPRTAGHLVICHALHVHTRESTAPASQRDMSIGHASNKTLGSSLAPNGAIHAWR